MPETDVLGALTYFVGTDIGTLGTKSVLVDPDGQVLDTAFEEYGVITPQKGWAEQWPDMWVKATFSTIKRVVKKSGANPSDIAGVCISSLYGGSGIPCDERMKPLRPCIIWADRRATEECRWVRDKIGVEEIFKVTGNVIDPYYGYTKMLWIREHEPKVWNRIHRFMTPNAYCIYKLTGMESVDLSSAGNYGGIFDIHKRIWSEEMMKALGIPRHLFPEGILSSEKVVGETTSESTKWTCLKPGTPVCAGGIDAAMSALGGGAILDGDMAAMLGTSMCNGFISHKPKFSPRLVNFPYIIKGREYLYSFTGVLTAGYCVKWFSDELCKTEQKVAKSIKNENFKLLDHEAEKVPPGCDGLIFLPHMMGGERAPYWDEHLRGGFLGLSVFHTKGHMFRAILEGVAYAMRYSIEMAREAGLQVKRATLVDGCANSKLWRQIIVDVTGLSMDYIPNAKGAPLGDALLAGVGTGVLADYNIIEDWLGKKVTTEPDADRVKTYNGYYELYKVILKANEEVFRKMGELTGI